MVARASKIPIRWWPGEGFGKLREAGIEVEMATDFAAEAAKLNEPFRALHAHAACRW